MGATLPRTGRPGTSSMRTNQFPRASILPRDGSEGAFAYSLEYTCGSSASVDRFLSMAAAMPSPSATRPTDVLLPAVSAILTFNMFDSPTVTPTDATQVPVCGVPDASDAVVPLIVTAATPSASVACTDAVTADDVNTASVVGLTMTALGGVVSPTVTVNARAALFPDSSVAVQGTGVVPMGNRLPEPGAHVTTGAESASSLALTSNETKAPFGPVASATTSSGRSSTGALVSSGALSITEIVLLAVLATYVRCVCGFTSIRAGPRPTGTVATTVFVVPSMMATEAPPDCAT